MINSLVTKVFLYSVPFRRVLNLLAKAPTAQVEIILRVLDLKQPITGVVT
jgi:hypothetical protein